MKQLLIALQFLSIIPVRIKSELEDRDFGESLLYFPLIGLLIGVILSAAAILLRGGNPLVRGAVLLIISVIVTGGIHLDGLADTLDGFYGGRDKERILEIMRDSSIGAIGAIGLALVLILKFSLYASYPTHTLWRVLIASSIFSRWAQTLACSISTYAREDGKGRAFVEHADKNRLIIATLFTVGASFILMGVKGFLIFFVSSLLIFIFVRYV
ncbi:MAG: adenosylcobinamide-GDP ribazoletransferase, partial [Nitrospinae bacterium]|nr:adenosylcobinamide-GDP ribazoletransferase [Nitrospinota bacterium]